MFLDRCVEFIKVVMEVSARAAKVMIANVGTKIELIVAARKLSTSLARSHLVLALALL